MLFQREMTAEQFLEFAAQHPDKRFDFVHGEVVEVSPMPVHGRIQAAFATALNNHNEENPVGVVYTEVLHELGGEKFIPDVCINIPTTEKYLTVAPVIAIEIRSESQKITDQREKVISYLKHGSKMAILVIPGESVEVHRQGRKVKILTFGDILDGEDVLPGFKIAVDKIL